MEFVLIELDVVDDVDAPSAALQEASVFANPLPDTEVEDAAVGGPAAAASSVDDDVDEEKRSESRVSLCIGNSSQSVNNSQTQTLSTKSSGMWCLQTN